VHDAGSARNDRLPGDGEASLARRRVHAGERGGGSAHYGAGRRQQRRTHDDPEEHFCRWDKVAMPATPNCHPERSEGSAFAVDTEKKKQIPRACWPSASNSALGMTRSMAERSRKALLSALCVSALILTLFSSGASAQTGSYKPEWCQKLPHPEDAAL